ncbi:DUF5995 family protein [Kitasatospora sp. RB6PN24]|uniref:DUF5995 family protein n=1 Tax=Kitasatospora humi TaxID=2893891 RepID=UPI001E5AE66A|nr:DUF5995 family protein [Kitasatospora humi]MCC9306298.1 DUF5995 family protein [Kitasatospora humi]
MSTEPAPAPVTQLPDTVEEVIQRMKQIDAELDTRDGVACFNRMYLKVTELVAAGITQGFFADAAFMERMDVVFADLYLRNIDADQARKPVNAAWRPLFDLRGNHRILPVQYALAGMNAHINHDLALSVVLTCKERRTTPDTAPVHADYLKVNQLLAEVEATVRAEFEPELVKLATEDAQTLTHLLSSFSIEAARDAAWLSVQMLWSQRGNPFTYDLACVGMADSTGMAGRLLLTPVVPADPS